MIKRIGLISFALLAAAAIGVAVRLSEDNAGETGYPGPRIGVSNAPPLSLKTPAGREFHGSLFIDTFAAAPVEWRTAGAGIATVQARWQCDPRWTFFTLENDRKIGKPAVMWHKRSFPGDLCVEFFFGSKMDASRGNPYSYERDVNVTISSDGSDLRNGYTFSFGGEGNTCSYIMRNGVVVARVPVTFPKSMDYHLHWFSFKAERIGGALKFSVDKFFRSNDGRGYEMIFEDSQPLAGDRIAIWTYDSPMSIAKVRLSGETDGHSESPDFLPAPLATVYDAR